MRTWSDLKTLIQTKLADTAGTIFLSADIDYHMEDCLKEYSDYVPNLVDVIFKIESRMGTDLTGTASSLTDTYKTQFVTADGSSEKVVHNVTDNTWAVITGYTSTSILTLSADIMDANESYEIYNKRCWNEKQIYLGDFFDRPVVHSVEYPIGTRRNFKIMGDILEIDLDFTPDSNTNLSELPNVDVLVRFVRPQMVSQLTDWAGEAAASASAAATSLAIDGIANSAIVHDGEIFYLQKHRTTYMVASSVVASSTGTATLTFYPGLETTVADNDDINFVKSTLRPQDENIFADLVAARLAINHAMSPINSIVTAQSALVLAASALVSVGTQIAAATAFVTTGSTYAAAASILIASATTAIAKVDAQIAAATASVTSAANTAYVTGFDINNAFGKYIKKADAEVGNARGYIAEAESYLSGNRADEAQVNTYAVLASKSLANAAQYVSQANGYFSKVSNELSVAYNGKHYREWGERKLTETLRRLERNTPPVTKRRYTRE